MESQEGGKYGFYTKTQPRTWHEKKIVPSIFASKKTILQSEIQKKKV